MTPNMQNLFDSLDEGLLMVSTEGVVRLANQAAMRLFPVIVDQPLATEEILAQVSAAACCDACRKWKLRKRK